MRAIWKGAITFGLVNVPVKVYSATEDHESACTRCTTPTAAGSATSAAARSAARSSTTRDIDKAYDDGERTVVLTEEDLASLPAEHSREIEVVEFVPSEQVDPIMFEKSYYLEPDSKSPKAYVLLRRTLEETDRTAIVQFALRQKTRLAALRVRGDVLVLQTLLWDDEVREAAFPALDETVRISAKEREMSASLVRASWPPTSSRRSSPTTTRSSSAQLIEAKLEQGDALDTAETFGDEAGEAGKGEVIDLMEALKRSLDRKRGAGGGEEAGGASKAPAKTAARSGTKTAAKAASRTGTAAKTGAATKAAAKTAATKTAAKPAATKTAANKTTATKTAAKPAATKTRRGRALEEPDTPAAGLMGAPLRNF